ncbi:hypothetical protein OG762_36885 [Streptomyces sp. NBC_01136]|uniref:hypothetical protein n=1 Tax=unclassified Streptomyces TaxID=2593676 RepID=UPI0032432A25|nr:hypothetical protein OG762_36885 [Streptomyces sp. NBC_01136]
MNAQQRVIESEKIARASLRAQSDKLIVETWMATNDQAPTREVTILRGWLMDELERRMDAIDKARRNQLTSRFDRWMLADCKAVANPGSYLI